MKIAATIVTYNRLESLKECITAIRNQSVKPDEIIIVNNGSTDNTLQWLNRQTDLKVVNQANTGSGGGQYTAMKTGYDSDADWVWTMDDDGIPHQDALKYLVNAIEQNPDKKVFNSLVIDKDDHSKIAFGYDFKGNFFTRDMGTQYHLVAALLTAAGEQWVLEGIPQFFNSTLINRSVLEHVGLPISDLFIRGDEQEYIYRIQKANIPTFTVVKSIMYHPNPQYGSSSLLGLTVKYEHLNTFKKYYTARNRIIIESNYFKRPLFTRFKIVGKELIFLLANFKPKTWPDELHTLYRAVNDANKFNYEKKLKEAQLL